MTEKERIEIALSKQGLHADKLTKSKGTWIFKESFFYKHGNSASEIASKIEKAFPKAEIISSENRWNRWPKTSWFIVKFKMEEI